MRTACRRMRRASSRTSGVAACGMALAYSAMELLDRVADVIDVLVGQRHVHRQHQQPGEQVIDQGSRSVKPSLAN